MRVAELVEQKVRVITGATEVPVCTVDPSSLLRKSGSGPIFGETTSFLRKSLAENLDLTPSLSLPGDRRKFGTGLQIHPPTPLSDGAPIAVLCISLPSQGGES